MNYILSNYFQFVILIKFTGYNLIKTGLIQYYILSSIDEHKLDDTISLYFLNKRLLNIKF